MEVLVGNAELGGIILELVLGSDYFRVEYPQEGLVVPYFGGDGQDFRLLIDNTNYEPHKIILQKLVDGEWVAVNNPEEPKTEEQLRAEFYSQI